MKKILFLSAALFYLSSCTTVQPGHKGVKVYWGGKTDMDYVLPEGMELSLIHI